MDDDVQGQFQMSQDKWVVPSTGAPSFRLIKYTDCTSNDVLVETGRLFYLSVPPKHFGPIAKYINKYVRPSRKSAFLRVVFEKPFGNDLPSAKKLAAELAAELKVRLLVYVSRPQ